MASRRDYRAATILEALEQTGAQGIAGLEEGTTVRLAREGFDEFLYVPERLVVAPPPPVSPDGVEFDLTPAIGRTIAERLRRLDGVREIDDAGNPPTADDGGGTGTGPYADRPGAGGGGGSEPGAGSGGAGQGTPSQPGPGGAGPTGQGQAAAGLVPQRFALAGGLDAVELAGRLSAEPGFAGWLAPEYVLLTHQRVLPGTDPEYGRFVGRPDPREGRSELGAGTTVVVIDTGLAPEAQAEGYLPGVSFDAGRDIDDLADPTVTAALRAEIESHLPPAEQAIAAELGAALPVLGPAAGHGTFIAGLLARLAPAAGVTVQRAFGTLGGATERHVARAIDRAGALQPDVLNLSFGMYGARLRSATGQAYFQPPLQLFHAIERLPPGTATVASAGNSDSQDPMYPAAFRSVYAVAALDASGWRWPHSNYGPWIDLSALGANLDGVYVRGLENDRYDADGTPELWHDGRANFARWSGTSFAAPLVAARVALLLGAARRSGLAITGRQAAELLRWSSPPAPEPGCGRRVHVDLPA